MIITNVCLLLEALSIVICLHHLYGEKFRLDIATVCYLSIDMISMAAVNYLGLSKVYTMIIYPFLILFPSSHITQTAKYLPHRTPLQSNKTTYYHHATVGQTDIC